MYEILFHLLYICVCVCVCVCVSVIIIISVIYCEWPPSWLDTIFHFNKQKYAWIFFWIR